jgi:hypothetical protein
VSFLIGFPLVGLGGTSRDDADNFFVVLLMKRMNDQQNRTRPYGSHRYPAFLIPKGKVQLRDRIRIVENENRSFKTNIMLAKVLPVLILVPFKSHGWVATETAYPRKPSMSIHLYVHIVLAMAAFDTGESVAHGGGGEGGIRT